MWKLVVPRTDSLGLERTFLQNTIQSVLKAKIALTVGRSLSLPADAHIRWGLKSVCTLLSLPSSALSLSNFA